MLALTFAPWRDHPDDTKRSRCTSGRWSSSPGPQRVTQQGLHEQFNDGMEAMGGAIA